MNLGFENNFGSFHLNISLHLSKNRKLAINGKGAKYSKTPASSHYRVEQYLPSTIDVVDSD